MALTIILMLLCAVMFGVGCIFFLIDLRTRFGPQFRYFAIQIIIFSIIGIIDQLENFPAVTPELRILADQIFHIFSVFFVINSMYFMQRIMGKKYLWIFWFFVISGAILLPLIFTPWMFQSNEAMATGGGLYIWTFVPYVFSFMIAKLFFLISHILITPKGFRKFPILHLMAWNFVLIAGILGVLSMVSHLINETLAKNCIPGSILAYGLMCSYFFSDQFLNVIREKSSLVLRLEKMSLDLEHLKPLGRLGESAAHISHEIKNYVGVLRSNNLLLQTRFKENGSIPEMERIARSAERLEDFTKSVLTFSQNPDRSTFSPIHLKPVIERSVRLHFPEQADRILVSGENPSTIQGDAGKLEQVFVNLIKNSFEADATQVEIQILEERDKIMVTVEDNGRGCAPEDIEKLTSPFHTTKKDRGGTGLGLSIAKAIVEGHSGTLQVRFLKGNKVGFRLTFPTEMFVEKR